MYEKAACVLLIENRIPGDGPVLRDLTHARTHFKVAHLGRLSEALQRLGNGEIDAILTDLTLPDSLAHQTVARLRQHDPRVPIIVLAEAAAADDVLQAALEQGAQECLSRDTVTSDILDRAVRYAIQGRQNSQMRELVEQVRASERLLAKKNRRLAKLYRAAHHAVDNVSHEFRTPLTVITEYVSLLRDGIVGPVAPEQCQMLDIIGDRADDLNTMVDDMLDVSKLQAGLLNVYRERCDLLAIVDRVRLSLDRKAAIRNARLQLDVDAALPPIYADAEKVGRVIVNLAVNAIKFCGSPGQVRIWANSDPAESQVVVGVTDNGAGLDSRQLASIFGRFKQLHVQPLGSNKGFGLGLSIAKELVDLNLGRMSVESQPGQGSSFAFTLPVARSEAVVPRYLDWLARSRKGASSLTLVKASVEDSIPDALADDVHAFLNYMLRHSDLLWRVSAHRWLLLLPIDEHEIESFLTRVAQAHQEVNRNRPQGALPGIALEIVEVRPGETSSQAILSAVRTICDIACPILIE